jgi:hypothetical protein
MAAERTMEDILQDVEKKGWVLSNLSCCGAAYEYSCILERGKKDDSGFGVFATSALCATPKEALLAAWAEAQRRSATSGRVDARHPDGKRKAAPVTETLAEVLDGHGGRQHRLRLQVAVANCISARTGEAMESII